MAISLVLGSFFAKTTTVHAAGRSNVIAFGDSLTEACYIEGSSQCGWLGGNGYYKELEYLLTQDPWTANRPVQIFNFGKGGEQTHEGLNRLNYLLETSACDQPASLILIMEGTNDLLQRKNVGNIGYNIELMIGLSRDHGLEILLATIPPDPDHAYKEIEALNKRIREIAVRQYAKYGDVTLVDQYAALAPDWGDYTTPRGCYGDRTHPNNAGFDAMAHVWYEALPDYMKPPPPLTALMILLGSSSF